MKIIKVESCEQCPYAYHVWADQYFCKAPGSERNTIPDGRTIPEWCRLLDADEGRCVKCGERCNYCMPGPAG